MGGANDFASQDTAALARSALGIIGKFSDSGKDYDDNVDWSGDVVGEDPMSLFREMKRLVQTLAVTPYQSAYDDSALKTLTAFDSADGDDETADDKFTDLWSLMAGLGASTDWGTFVTSADTKADAVLDSTSIDDAVDEFETDTLDAHNRSLNRLAAGAVEANAVNSSAFVLGMALVENGYNKQVRKFRADLTHKFEDKKFALIMQGTNEMVKMLLSKIDLGRLINNSLTEHRRIKFVADAEKARTDIEFALNAELWDAKIFQMGANVLATAVGGIGGADPLRPTPMQSAIGGAASGAATGAALTGGNPIGAGVGAVAGGIGGYLSA